jgi:SpoVK/Ycf46/Vps4 family AAA+-type ATPase
MVKKTILKALAEQADCNYVEIDMMQSDREILTDLLKVAQKSQKDYENNGAKKRTMVLLEEFDSISSENVPFISKMKHFLSDCAEKYKCTIFMTSIHPIDFGQELFTEQRVPLKIFINPPEKEDAAEIFKFHLKNSGEASIDYNKLADEVINARKSGQAYSSSRISRVIDNCRDLAADYLQKITESDLIYELKKSGPDISKETMEKFGKEFVKMGKNIL